MKFNLKTAFLNVCLFMLVSVLLYIQKSDVLSHSKKASEGNRNDELLSMRKKVEYFFWPERKFTDKLSNRRTMWENLLSNSTRSQKRDKRLPDVLVIGAERCGAEALGKLLQLHPLIRFIPGDIRYFTRYYSKGSLYYRDRMPWATENEVTLEVSPLYFSWPPMTIPKRVKTTMPKAKILAVLCNPVDRVSLDFQEELKAKKLPQTTNYETFLGTYLRKFGRDKLARYMQWDEKIQSIIFDSFTEDYASHIVTSAIYYYHVIRWKAEFDSNHIMFISRDDMIKNTGKLFEKLQDFLELPKLLFEEDFTMDEKAKSNCFQPIQLSHVPSLEKRCPLRNQAHKVAVQSNACIQTLKNFFNQHNKKLFHILKENFGW